MPRKPETPSTDETRRTLSDATVQPSEKDANGKAAVAENAGLSHDAMKKNAFGHPRRRATDKVGDRAGSSDDDGLALARQDAVKFLHGRRQAIFALARQYFLDADDLQQEAYEVLLTCLRDFTPTHTRADGTTVNVQFNTFFGTRLEGKALEMRNRDPEYLARQAHFQDLSDEERDQFRKDPPLLVQHLDQETSMQEHLRGEAARMTRRNRDSLGQRLMQDNFIERKLNELIAAERDEKRRAALMHVKVGGVSSFEEIAYHFGVTDSRASQIMNDLMDAFYVQRLLDGDLKAVAYDFRKLRLQEKRAMRLLDEALSHARPDRAADIANTFAEDYPAVRQQLARLMSQPTATVTSRLKDGEGALPEGAAGSVQSFQNGVDALSDAEKLNYPLQTLEWRQVVDLVVLPVLFRPEDCLNPGQIQPEPAHIARLMTVEPDHWPLLITDKGQVIDGQRRLEAARKRGIDRVLCQVIAVPDDFVAATLRIALNLRTIRADKPDLYWAIAALLERGLSQQKISHLLGTSRPNVIVYAKVKEKATPELRKLFEDGLIQITNASTVVDLPIENQRQLVDYIRQFGADWGRGPRFNELYEAASTNAISALKAKYADESKPSAFAMPTLPSKVAEAPNEGVASAENDAGSQTMRRRQQVLESALRDAEVWSRQREAALAQQTQQNIELKAQIESLTREIQASQLIAHGDQATLKNYLKDVREFTAFVERLASSAHHIEKSARQLRSMALTYRQIQEIEDMYEKLSTQLNSLRTELVNRRRTPSY